MRALGVRPLIAHIEGRSPIDAAGEQAKAETRQFAKRQTTWLKRYMLAWDWIDTQELQRNTEEIISIIDS